MLLKYPVKICVNSIDRGSGLGQVPRRCFVICISGEQDAWLKVSLPISLMKSPENNTILLLTTIWANISTQRFRTLRLVASCSSSLPHRTCWADRLTKNLVLLNLSSIKPVAKPVFRLPTWN
jgi:hypothetical protein